MDPLQIRAEAKAQAFLASYGCALDVDSTTLPLRPGWGEEGIHLAFGSDLAVRARDSRRITISLRPDADPDLIVQTALGPGLAACWTLRGHPVLHGSCVAIGGRAVCFVGPAGRGKSTLAAQLHLRGHRPISDGSTLLTAERTALWAHPGPAWFKLDESSLRALHREPSHYEPVRAGAEKRLWELETLAAPSTPLVGIYVLEDGDPLCVEHLRGGEATSRVFENMYLLPFLPADAAPRLFRQAADVARAVQVVRLQRPRGFEWAERTIEFVEQDIHRLQERSRLPQAAGPACEPDTALEDPCREG